VVERISHSYDILSTMTGRIMKKKNIAEQLIDLCNIDEYKCLGDNYVMRCAINEDGEPSCSLHKEGYFKCFSCGARGTAVDFLKHRLGISGSTAKRMLGQKNNLITDIEQELNGRNRDKAHNKRQLRTYKYPNPRTIELCGKYLEYVRKRGITHKQVVKHKIRCAKNGRFRGRIVFPIMFGGKCRGVTARAVERKTKPKWLHTRHLFKNSLFYGYDRFVLGQKREAILVEGPIDFLSLERAGKIGKRVLATFNANLSEEQTDLLRTLGVERLVVAYDMDRAGHRGYLDILKNYGEEFDVFRWIYARKGDPGSISPAVLKRKCNRRYLKRHIYDEKTGRIIDVDKVYDFI